MLLPPSFPQGMSLFNNWLITDVRMNNRILTWTILGWKIWNGALEVPAKSYCRAQKIREQRESQWHCRIGTLHGHFHSRQSVNISHLESWFKVTWNYRNYMGDKTSPVPKGSLMLPFIWGTVEQHLARVCRIWRPGEQDAAWKSRLDSSSVCSFDISFVIVSIIWMDWWKQAWVCWFSLRCYSSHKALP